MPTQTKDLWSLVKYRPQVDPDDLAEAIVAQIDANELDYRTRLLIRDSTQALESFWGKPRFHEWLLDSAKRKEIEAICAEEFERPGFPSLVERLMEKTDAAQIKSYLRELGQGASRSQRLDIGGSAAVIIPGMLVRNTDDVDIVDEVPKELREKYELLSDLKKRYGLQLGHFQRHYLPLRWESRVHFLDYFGPLAIYLIDAKDFFLSKVFSRRKKDLDDLRMLAPQLDKQALAQMLRDDCASALASEEMRQIAENNWYIVYGDPLPA